MARAIPQRTPATPVFNKALGYMGFTAGEPIIDQPVDVVFIGSCTNGRLSDLRGAAQLLRGHKVARGVQLLVVPGSQQVKRAAEAEGLDRVFIDAGAEWRESGCSMCIGMNGDNVGAGQDSVSTSNRNFEGRQGPGARTLLASPLTAAASAVRGRVTDPRTLLWELGVGMEPMKQFVARTVVLPAPNIDTDQIIPARFLRTTMRTGLGRELFADWRYDGAGAPRPDFPLNQPAARGCAILVAGRQLRLRLLARARALGAARLRLPRGDQHGDRRHLHAATP